MGSRVMTMGSFDLFHVGHLSLLKTCEAIAGDDGQVYIGVNSDSFIRAFKRKPVISWEERVRIIKAVSPNSVIFEVTEHDASKHVSSGIDFLVIGSDWAKKDYFKQIGVDINFLKKNGVTLLYKQIDEDITTSEIIQRIRDT